MIAAGICGTLSLAVNGGAGCGHLQRLLQGVEQGLLSLAHTSGRSADVLHHRDVSKGMLLAEVGSKLSWH